MALYSHPSPLRYGTVITDSGSKVISFIEKPCWERVVTDLVNTAVYIWLSPKALEALPQGEAFDFAQDWFSLLTGEGAIYGAAYGWPIGATSATGRATARCCMDALEGRLSLPLTPPPDRLPRILILRGTRPLICGCHVSEDVHIGRGAVIERSVLHSGSVVGDFCRVKDSVIDGAELGAECDVFGSIICRGAKLPANTRTLNGDIVSAALIPTRQRDTSPAAPSRRHGRGLCRELSCGNRAQLMRQLSSALWEAGADFSDGITLTDGRCKVRISPLPTTAP